jgi:hypothetical protein
MPRELARLLGFFAAWKTLLLAVVLLGPGCDRRGAGYDTSTRLLLGPAPAAPVRLSAVAVADGIRPAAPASAARRLARGLGERLALRATRWDAVYFTRAAVGGARTEQEWAFGWGFSALLARVDAALFPPPRGVLTTPDQLCPECSAPSSFSPSGAPPPHRVVVPDDDGSAWTGFEAERLRAAARAGVAVSVGAHLAAVLLLRALAARALPDGGGSGSGGTTVAAVAAALHVASPAGAFLAAPYAEASFAALSFGGALAYSLASASGGGGGSRARRAAAVLAAGALWGAAATMRSNGVFAGLVFAYDALVWAAAAAARVRGRRAWGVVVAGAGAAAAAAAGVWRAGVLDERVRTAVDVLGPARVAGLLALAVGGLAVLGLTGALARGRRVAFLAADVDRLDKPSIFATLAAGAMVAAGFAYPQYLAYQEYCADPAAPGAVWCADMPPSVYASIQARYWYVSYVWWLGVELTGQECGLVQVLDALQSAALRDRGTGSLDHDPVCAGAVPHQPGRCSGRGRRGAPKTHGAAAACGRGPRDHVVSCADRQPHLVGVSVVVHPSGAVRGGRRAFGGEGSEGHGHVWLDTGRAFCGVSASCIEYTLLMIEHLDFLPSHEAECGVN